MHFQVYAYGLGTRTSILGVAVVIVGIVVVLARTVLKLLIRTEDIGAVAMLAAALRYVPIGGEREMLRRDEKGTGLRWIAGRETGSETGGQFQP